MRFSKNQFLIAGVLFGCGALIVGQTQQRPVAKPATAKTQPRRPAQAQSSEPERASSPGVQFTTLPGFTIERVVPASNTDSYVVVTFDSLGRPVVSKEQDHPRILIDNDGDGIYETQKVFSDKVKNCQGLFFDGRVLYANCGNATGNDANSANGGRAGMWRLEDTDGDDVADRVEQITQYVGGIQEHGPHAIRRAADGQIYTILGNNTFLDKTKPLPNSPFKGRESQFLPALPDGRGFGNSTVEGTHGSILRLNRPANSFTLFYAGLRNSYDFVPSTSGEFFTFDSDMEWDINMPWYRPIRSVHVIQGGDNGYRNGSGKFPPYYLDSLPPMVDLGRGSPVGVEFYESALYPKKFQGAYFEADWSRGRLLWTQLQRNGASYKPAGESAEFIHGEPLNITDLETGPDGMMYFTIGGRNTEGGIFRVRYKAPAGTPATPKPTGILAVVRQAQPLSSYGWAAIEKAKTSMGEAWSGDLTKLALNKAALASDRAQAIYILQAHGPAIPIATLKTLAVDPNVAIRAAAIYAAGQHEDADARKITAGALKDIDPLVKRRAAEALVRQGLTADQPSFAPVADVYQLLNSPDRFVRFAGRLALERTPRAEWRDLVAKETNPLGATEGMVALVNTSPTSADLEGMLEKQLSLLKNKQLSLDNKLRVIRAFQLTAIENKASVRPELKKQFHGVLFPQFPSTDARLNRELATTLAYLGQPETIGKILEAIPADDENQQQQLHYAYALRVIKEGWTKEQKEQMMDWFAKASKWRGGASFPGFLNLMFDASIENYSKEEKQMAYQKVPTYAPMTAEESEKARNEMLARLRAGRAAQGQGGGQGAAQGQGNQEQQVNAAVARMAQRPGSTRSKGVQAISKEELFDELIFTPQRAKPNPATGQPIFEKECSQCHRFGGLGNDFGPDLTTLNNRFKKRDIVEAIIWPSKTISDQYESTIITTKENDIINGLIVNEDANKLVVKTAEVERPIDLPKSTVQSRRKSKISIMPEGLLDPYSQNEIAALIAFLQSEPPKKTAAK